MTKTKMKTTSSRKRIPAGKRELINTGVDKRYVRRTTSGQFLESDDMGRSLASDVRQAARTKVKSGQGDRGDRASRTTAATPRRRQK